MWSALCCWQGCHGWFSSSLGASVSSAENSRGGLEGISGPGRSEFLWLQYMGQLPYLAPSEHLLRSVRCQPPSASQDQKGLALQGSVMDGQTLRVPRCSRDPQEALPSQEWPTGLFKAVMLHQGFLILLMEIDLFISSSNCFFPFPRVRCEGESITWSFPAPWQGGWAILKKRDVLNYIYISYKFNYKKTQVPIVITEK